MNATFDDYPLGELLDDYAGMWNCVHAGDVSRLLAGRGRVVHVGLDRATGQSVPWPAMLLAQCWPGARDK